MAGYGDRLTIKTSFEGKPYEHSADEDRIAIDSYVGGKYLCYDAR